jgi:hypothetical protein
VRLASPTYPELRGTCVVTRTLEVAAVALVVALGVACSGGDDEDRLSKQAYERKVQTVYADVQQAFLNTRGASDQELAGRIALAQEALRHAADQLAAVNPPEEVEVHNADLVEGMREYADALDAAVQAASRGNREVLARFRNVAANPGVREMAEAAEEMKHKGYDLGPIAQE